MLNELYQALDPIAFSFGSLVVRWYGLAYLASFIFSAFWMYRLSRKWRLSLSFDDISLIVLGAAFGVIFGGRIIYVIFYAPQYYLAHPSHLLFFHEGGMSFHGGLLGACIGGYIACRMSSISFMTMADLAVCAAPTGLFFGRIANFINGELWGKPTDLPWAVAFPSGGYVMRHPSQLYEALLEGALLFLVLWYLSSRSSQRPQGFYLSFFLLWYGCVRFLVEFVRLPDAQLGYLLGWLTMGQLLSIPLIIIGCFGVWYALKRNSAQQGKI